jgi:cell division septum initiation protein DivIVA
VKKSKEQLDEQSSDIYKLKKENRELQDQIHSLQKQLKKEAKREEKKANKTHKTNTTQKEETLGNKCPKCKDSNIENVDIGVRTLQVCKKKCGFRKAIKHV